MRLDLLRELVQHCRTKPGLKEFNFNIIYGPAMNQCGTAGCLMGEMAHCWPDQFNLISMDDNRANCPAGAVRPQDSNPAVPRWKRYPWATATEDSVELAAAWFEIPSEDARWLFLPYEDHARLGSNDLSTDSTLEEVLAGVERYIARYESTTSPGA